MIINVIKKDNSIELIDSNHREELKSYYDNKDSYEFYCSCNKQPRMTIGKKQNYYIQSISGEKSKHTETCIFKGKYFKSLKGYHTDDETGDLCFSVSTKRLEADIQVPDEDELNQLIKNNDKEQIDKYFTNRGITKNKLSFNAFVTKMLIDAWNSYYKKCFYESTIGNVSKPTAIDFFKYFYGKSHKYRYNNCIVHEALAGNDISIDFEMGIMLEAQKGITKTDIFFKTILKDSQKRTINDELFEKEKKSLRTKTESYLIFLRRDAKGKYKTIQEVAIIPITKYGLPVESSYEASFYESLIDNKVLFEKPYELLNSDYPYVPDAIISYDSFRLNNKYATIFKLETEKSIIFELFGIQGNEAYDRLKETKKNIGTIINSNKESTYTFTSVNVSSIDDITNYFKDL